jgi:hypothetical protein
MARTVYAGHVTDDEHVVDGDDANAPRLHRKLSRGTQAGARQAPPSPHSEKPGACARDGTGTETSK